MATAYAAFVGDVSLSAAARDEAFRVLLTCSTEGEVRLPAHGHLSLEQVERLVSHYRFLAGPSGQLPSN